MASKKTQAQVEFSANTSGFDEGIKSMDQSLGTLRKELKLNGAELKGNADDVDLLSKRKSILQQESDASSKKIELLSNKLKEAERVFGSNSKEVQLLNNKLIDAKTVHQNIQNEITQTDKKINSLGDETKDLRQEMDKTNDSTDDLGDGFTVLKGVMADLIADGIRGVADGLKDLALESGDALSKFQGQTGLSTKEMTKFKGSIEELYAGNYGESISDIANAMAEVKQQSTGFLDNKSIKEYTKNAIVLRDTFDMDIKESMRAVNMLTAQFGITGQEAFNLIVQGAQNGLDKNGDLLDSINEYSVHYKQLGFTSEEFFNSLVNGTSAGTFSVDKLGDAMKEFGIRSKDTAQSTTEGFELIGLNADKMREKFAQGGEISKKAFDETLTALMSVDDQVKQNQAGVDLFGTMWEDLGIEGVSALSDLNSYAENTNVEINKSKKSMEELDQVRYDNVQSQLQQIGRTVQMNFITPILEDLLPPLKTGLEWIGNNLNWLLPVITSLGVAFMTYFAVGKITSFIGVVTNLINLVKTGTSVVGALNTVMALNPIGLIIAAVAGLIAIFVLLWNKCDGFRNFWIGLWDGIKQVFGAIVDWIKVAIDNIIGFFQGLWEGLKTIWDGIVNVIKFAFNLIVAIIKTYFQLITLPFRFIWENCKDTIMKVFNTIKDFIVKIWDGIKNYFITVFNIYKTIFSTVWNAIKGVVTTVVNAIKGVIEKVFNAIKSVVTTIWEGIKKVIITPITSAYNTVKGVVINIKDSVVNTFNSVKDKVTSIFNKVKDAIWKPIDTAKTKVKGIINTIKGFFDFKFKLPNIKLPHFGISPKGWKIGDLLKGTIPKLNIDWYAKGAIFTKPTIFNTGNGLKGFGEAGAEVALPIERLEDWMNSGFSSIVSNNYYNAEKIERLIEIGEKILNKPNNTYLNGRKVSEELASDNDDVSGNRYNFKNRGMLI